jgi:diaminohydroxyphosphoribosylaminopyrimidine deaminase/5-amino-6-(5-phosphoribosylamino)uracil reductase
LMPTQDLSGTESCNPMRLALDQALLALTLSDPNPRVGCVLTSPDGKVLGLGHTQAVGGPHAEIMALRDAAARGHSTLGATAFVSLEPCSHTGRTGPCCDALVQSGVQRVIAAVQDPNPMVSGQGLARMRSAGVSAELLPSHDPMALEARELNIGFFSRMVRGKPWVRLKIAASLDGITALPDGTSQWITQAAARSDGHAWRSRASAVMTGIGTVLHDNPQLDVRLVPSYRQPAVVVVDSQLQTPPDAAFFGRQRPVWIYTAQPAQDPRMQAHTAALQRRGAQITDLPGYRCDGSPSGKVDLAAMLHDLARRAVNELHLEAGHTLNGSMLRENLVDELLVYLAPKLLGSGAGMLRFGPLAALADAVSLSFHKVHALGADLCVQARIKGRADF